MTIEMDELGRWWVFNDDGEPFSGPYDDPDAAALVYPDAEIIWEAQ